MREQVLEIAKNIRPDIDFENETKLIDDELLESFDVIQLVTEFMEKFDVVIDADDIEAENLNSIDAMVALISSRM